jgi:hypothetical protein
MPRRFLCLVAVIVASQAWPLSVLWPALPSGSDAGRSPSSDVLMQMLPLRDAAERIYALDRALPQSPGVVVGHAPGDQLASAYFVLAMRLWPRSVSYVACLPEPHVEQFRSPHPVPPFAWRVDLFPGTATPVVASGVPAPDDAAALCVTRPAP